MTSRVFSLGMLLLAAAAASTALRPQPEGAFAQSCFCSSQTRTTDSRTVGGPDWRGPGNCGQARAVLHAQLREAADCLQGACQERLVIIEDCQMDEPKWYPVSGFLRYTCNECPAQAAR